MALTDGNGSDLVMPVAPMYGGNGGGGFGNSGFGGDWAWIILLLLLGWGNNGNGNGFGGGYGFGGFAADGAALYPWMNQAEITSDGFRDQMINNNITSIRDGISDISTQLCNGFAGVNAGVANGFAQAEIAANGRQMASMNQNFGLQTSILQGFNSLGSQFADCCCENRLASADLKYTIATENCADRAAISDGIRDVITNQTANTQRILDQLCADKIDAKNEKIADLERKLTMADLRASQIAQTAEIQRGQVGEVDALYQRLRDCPVPTQPVYGSQPIFTCPQNNCGCGCGGNNGCGCGNF